MPFEVSGLLENSRTGGGEQKPPPDAITDDLLFYEQQTIKRLRPTAPWLINRAFIY
jgi:hypothetical protein